jgi:hypothetical protein
VTAHCPGCHCRTEADLRRRVIRLTFSMPVFARAEREAAARGIGVAQWIAELVEVALVDRRRAAREDGRGPTPTGVLAERRVPAP